MFLPSSLVISSGMGTDGSSTARSFLTRPPTGRHVSPALPSDCFAIDFPGRAISPGEGFLFPSLRHHTFFPKGVADCPSLRASSDHRFIVGALRARRAPGRSFPILLRPRVARAQKIIRLHPLFCSGSKGSARVSFHPFHRARSASKKSTWPLPSHPIPPVLLRHMVR